MEIAALWTGWKNPEDGQILRSFTMLTVNADDHPFMRNYYKPKDEKRMVVILDDAEYDAWLIAAPDESLSFMRQYPAERMEVKSG